MGQIYSISWENGCYVGQTGQSALGRWAEHITLLKNGKHHNRQCQEVYDSLGISAFSFRILDINVDADDLDEREAYWSQQLGSINDLLPNVVKSNKRRVILELLDAGKTYRDIARQEGVSLGFISKLKRTSDLL